MKTKIFIASVFFFAISVGFSGWAQAETIKLRFGSFIPAKHPQTKVQAAWAEKTITFATNANFPPMEFVDKKDRIVGYAIEYMEAAGMLAGFKPVFKRVDWNELVAGLNEGQYDAICSSASITEARKKEFDFSEPYYLIKQVQVVFRGVRFRNPEDRVGIRVGAQVGSTGYKLGENTEGIELRPYDDMKTAMDELIARRLEAVICDDPVAAYYANTKYKNLLQITQFIKSAEEEEYGIVDQKGNKEILELINTGIAKVKARGIDRELQQKWMGR